MADASKLKRKNSLGAPPPEEEASPNLHEPEIALASSSLNLGQAAREVGKSRSVIYNALKSGRLSGKYNDKGEWEIDPAELLRVFSPQDLQENSLELEGTYKNALLEFLREQLHDAKELVNQAREREDQALERERESREREARLLLLLAIEQEARRGLEQKLLAAPIPVARSRHVQWMLLGVLLTGVSSIGAYLLHDNYKTVDLALSRILSPAEVAAVADPASVSAVNSAVPQGSSAEVVPPPASAEAALPPSQSLLQEEAKTVAAELPSPSLPLPAEVETVSAPASPVAVNAPEVPVLAAAPAPAPPSQRPQQPRPNSEPTRQSWWWWWW
ncbi:MAG: hypothetical protein QG599_3256 [Pseudomonadota bacterium]|nr:hypothetical protein [Pseudomonadota bacterium]